MNSSRVEGILTIKPSAFMRKECDDRDLSVEPMELRSIEVRLETGEREVLLTNLMDSEKWSASDFEELYHQGWAIEKGYKLDESRLEFERWRGKSVHAVEQDFYGRMLLVTLSACLASVAESLVAVKTEKCEHHYQVNQT
jgi:IS4 transposase